MATTGVLDGYNIDTVESHIASTSNPHSVTASQTGANYTVGSVTDNGIPRWDGADGDKLQNSTITISDTGALLAFSTEAGKTQHRVTLSPGDADNLSVFGYDDASSGYKPITIGAQGSSGSNSNITFNPTVMNAKGDLTFATAAKISNGESSPDCANGGITSMVDSSEGSRSNITCKGDDVAHGITTLNETDTFFLLEPNTQYGGAKLRGFAGNNGTSNDGIGFNLQGFAYNPNNDTATTATGAVTISAYRRDGTSYDVMGAGGNCFVVRQGTTARFIVKGNGDIKYDGSAAAYDSEDDLALVEVAKDLKNELNNNTVKALESRQRLKELEIISEDPENPEITWVSHQKMQALQLGAVSQLNKKLEEATLTQQATIDSLTARLEKLEKMIMPKDDGQLLENFE